MAFLVDAVVGSNRGCVSLRIYGGMPAHAITLAFAQLSTACMTVIEKRRIRNAEIVRLGSCVVPAIWKAA